MATRKAAKTKKGPGAAVPGWDPKKIEAIVGKAGEAARGLADQAGKAASKNIMAVLLMVFKESVKQQNEDKRLWLQKLAALEKSLDAIQSGKNAAQTNLQSLAGDLNKACTAMAARSKQQHDRAMKVISKSKA
jgi:hypothetical protein